MWSWARRRWGSSSTATRVPTAVLATFRAYPRATERVASQGRDRFGAYGRDRRRPPATREGVIGGLRQRLTGHRRGGAADPRGKPGIDDMSYVLCGPLAT